MEDRYTGSRAKRSAIIGDNCGVFGMFGESDCTEQLACGLFSLQHRGNAFGGMAVTDGEGIQLESCRGPISSAFGSGLAGLSTSRSPCIRSMAGIGYVGRLEPQPIRHRSRFGQLALAFAGKVRNAPEVLAGMLAQGRSFAEGTQAEVLSKVIGSQPDVVTGLQQLFKVVDGAYSLLLLTTEGLYAARDPKGIRPLLIGWGDGRWAVASESRALHGLNLMLKRDLLPGEIVRIDPEGMHVESTKPASRIAHCAFEWAYISGQDSVIEGIWVRDARKRMGEALALRDKEDGPLLRERNKPGLDVVAPVPRSGIGTALGYHAASGLPYEEVFLDLRGALGYETLVEDIRVKAFARSVVRPAVQNRRILLCEDSLVRGSRLQKRVSELRAAGASQVHVRVACPPIMHACPYGVATRPSSELVGRHFIPEGKLVDGLELDALGASVARMAGADSLRYNSLADFVRAIGLPRQKLCLHCFDGSMP